MYLESESTKKIIFMMSLNDVTITVMGIPSVMRHNEIRDLTANLLAVSSLS